MLAVRWSGRQPRSVASGCASRCATYRWRSASWAASGADQPRSDGERVGVEAHSSGRRALGGVEQLAQLGVEVLLAERLRRAGVLAEAQRVVEVGGGRQQVGVHPHAVAGLGALPGAQRAPQRRGVAQPARPQLEADQRGEGLLGRSAGSAAAAEGLLQLAGAGHPLVGGLADDLVDPALDEGEGDLEPLRARPSGRGSRAARTCSPSSSCCIDSGLVGSMPRICSSTRCWMPSTLTSMPSGVRPSPRRSGARAATGRRRRAAGGRPRAARGRAARRPR